jgi:hypothetical protein
MGCSIRRRAAMQLRRRPLLRSCCNYWVSRHSQEADHRHDSEEPRQVYSHSARIASWHSLRIITITSSTIHICVSQQLKSLGLLSKILTEDCLI